MSQNRIARRGFALLVVVTIVAIFAMLSIAITSRARVDSLRTQQAAADAQLRQMLLAGVHHAPRFVSDVGASPDPIPLSLPPELRELGRLTVHRVESDNPAELTLIYEARLDRHRAIQRLTLDRETGQIIAAEIEFEGP